MRDTDSHSIASPLIASGILGAGAYGSYTLDNYLDKNGIRKGLTINPKALKAIRAYANARPEDMRDPSKFIYRYSDLANKASKVRLFNEDPKAAWEWFSNEKKMPTAISNLIRKAKRYVHKVRYAGLDDLDKKILSPIIGKTKARKLNYYLSDKLIPLEGGLGSVEKFFKPLDKRLKLKRTDSARKRTIMEAAHEAEIGQTKARALIRLMNEGGTLQTMHPEQLANTTAEALYNWNKIDTKFKNPTEYFASMVGGNDSPKNMFNDYMRHFKSLKSKDFKSKKEMLAAVREILMPGRIDSTKRITGSMKGLYGLNVSKNVGPFYRWGIDDITGNLMQGEPVKMRPGIKNVRDVRRIVNKSPMLTWIRTGLSNGYTGREFGHLVNGLNILQKIRNPRIRIALGLGSAGLGALGLTNIGRTIFEKTNKS